MKIEEIGNAFRKDSLCNQITSDKMITVENYVERFQPIIIVKEIKKLVHPLIDDVKKTIFM